MKWTFAGAAAMAALLSAVGPNALAGPSSRADFLKTAIKGDNSEIKLGNLAAQKGATPGVRHFGRTLVTDHMKARAQAARVADRLGINAPSRPMAKAEAEYMKLRTLSGRHFDREFVRYMVRDHRHDIGEFSQMAREHNGPVGDLAHKQLPTLRKHLHMAESLMNM